MAGSSSLVRPTNPPTAAVTVLGEIVPVGPAMDGLWVSFLVGVDINSGKVEKIQGVPAAADPVPPVPPEGFVPFAVVTLPPNSPIVRYHNTRDGGTGAG